jgi:hypothetical protein
VPLRYLLAFTAVIITSIGQFARQRGVDGAELEQFQHAWSKAVLLEIALWSRPYAHPGWW